MLKMRSIDKLSNRFPQCGVRLFALILCLSLLAGCAECRPCVKAQLPVEPDPIMVEVKTDATGKLDADGIKAMLINLQLYKGALDKCNMSIQKHNQLAVY